MDEKTPARGLIDALAILMDKVGAVGKNRQMQGQQSYNYRSIEDMLPVIQPALVECGLVVLPQLQTWEVHEVAYRGGGKGQEARVTVAWTIHYGADKLVVTSAGQAMDTSDKALSKAWTQAEKLMWQAVLHIPTTLPDPDHDSPQRGEHVEEPVWTVTQIERAKHLQERLDHLPRAVYDDLMHRVEQRVGHGVTQITDLVPDALDRWERTIAEAESRVDAGGPDQADGEADHGDDDGHQQADQDPA